MAVVTPEALCTSVALGAGGVVMLFVGRSKDKEARMLRQARAVELEQLPAALEGSQAGREYVVTSGFVQ